jgi:hypothetical protein
VRNEAKKMPETDDQTQTTLQFSDSSQATFSGSGGKGKGGGGGGGGGIGMITPPARNPVMSAKKWWEEDMEEEAAYSDALEEAESLTNLRRESVADRLSSLISLKSAKETIINPKENILNRVNNSLN